MLTPDQLEACARRLCKLRGHDPEGSATFADMIFTPAWEAAATEILAKLQVDEALAGVEP